MAENEDFYKTEELPVALVIAGIEELEAHGLRDFSLRRVANRCGVSCAAPYRHFHNKNALILAMINYVNQRWSTFGEQIISAYEGDVRRQIIELCVANAKFWNANPSFRYIMFLDKRSFKDIDINEGNRVGGLLRDLIGKYCLQKGIPEKEEELYFSVRALLYGSAQMLITGELDVANGGFDTIRTSFEGLF